MVVPDSDRLRSPAARAALGAFGVAAILAFLCRGLAGDEEVGHFLMAQRAPEQPEFFLSLIGRPLVTLFFALPAQIDLFAVRLAAAVATGFCAYAVARVAIRTGWLGPGWVVGLLLVQPFFLAHASKAMTEPLAAALLAWGILAVVEGRWKTLAWIAALLPLARTETVIFWPMVLVLLARNRSLKHLWILPLPILVWNGLGALQSGDPLWLLNQSRWKAYPQRNWMDYPRSLVWILSLGVFVPFLVGLTRSVLTPRNKPAGDAQVSSFRLRALASATVMVLAFFVLYSILAVWHPITFGNLRYFAYAGPALALLAAAGIHALREERGLWLAMPLGAAILGSIFVWNHPLIHDFGIMVKNDWTPAVVAVIWIACLALPRRLWLVFPVIAVTAGAIDTFWRHTNTLQLYRNPEEAAIKQAAELAEEPGFHLAHPAVAYFQDRNYYDRSQFFPVTQEIRNTAPPGTVLFWETHYTVPQNPKLAAPGFFTDPTWEFLGGVAAADSSWAGGYFVRRDSLGDRSTGFRVASGMDENTWKTLSTLIQMDIPMLNRNLRQDPANAQGWRDFSDRLGIAGLKADARNALERAKRLEPDNYLNFAFEANLHRLDDNPELALTAAQKAVEGNPNDGVMHYLMARVLLDLDHNAEAIKHLTLAANQLTKRWDIQFDAARTLHQMRRFADAESYALAAWNLQPQKVSYLVLLCEIEWRVGKQDQAVSRLRAFIDRQPHQSTPHLMLGDFLNLQGKSDEARAVWEEGLNATGDPRIASRLSDR